LFFKVLGLSFRHCFWAPESAFRRVTAAGGVVRPARRRAVREMADGAARSGSGPESSVAQLPVSTSPLLPPQPPFGDPLRHEEGDIPKLLALMHPALNDEQGQCKPEIEKRHER